eukprot:8628219-Lingulodinium_polyedra.AAC.1
MEPEVVWRAPGTLSNYPNFFALVDIKGEHELVIGWINGVKRVQNASFVPVVVDVMTRLHREYSSGRLAPAAVGAPWARRVYREANTLADSVCNRVMDRKASLPSEVLPVPAAC